ncbi:MAG: SatD family protein [Candidatus Eisenbacteria bacterium]|nr:SatD family protein [Candidatus Eisenbacteria bacterium]
MVHSSEETRYLAVIGDIRGSRLVPRRAELQKFMERGLEEINREFADELVAGFVITLGDEFQGLLREPGQAVKVLVALEAVLGETPVRYGLGWGGVSTELRELSVGMDGPCFHRAREAVEEGKRADRWATVCGFGEDDEILNGLLWLVGAVRGRWTSVQRETVRQVRGARTQREAAAARGVHESSVSQALKAALHDPVSAAERSAEALLLRHSDLHPEGEAVREVTK